MTETCLETASAKSDFSWLPSQESQAQPASLRQSGKEDPSSAFSSRLLSLSSGLCQGLCVGRGPEASSPRGGTCDLGPGAASGGLGREAGRTSEALWERSPWSLGPKGLVPLSPEAWLHPVLDSLRWLCVYKMKAASVLSMFTLMTHKEESGLPQAPWAGLAASQPPCQWAWGGAP